MGEGAVLRALSCVFGPFDREAWIELTEDDTWGSFLSAAKAMVAKRGEMPSAAASVFSALRIAPSADEHHSFAARCLTGGLPSSAIPVESFYHFGEGGRRCARYLQDPALYMESVFKSLGLEVPRAFVAMPDHLSLELEVVALYWDLGLEDQAKSFLRERTGWLPAYRQRLAEVAGSNGFYACCIDLILMFAAPAHAGSEDAV